MNETPSDGLTVADLPDLSDPVEVAEFAHTFDG